MRAQRASSYFREALLIETIKGCAVARLQRRLAVLASFSTTPLASFLGSFPFLSQDARKTARSKHFGQLCLREGAYPLAQWRRRPGTTRTESMRVLSRALTYHHRRSPTRCLALDGL